MKRSAGLSLAASALLALLLSSPCLGATTLTLATGGEGGVYFPLGGEVKRLVQESCRDIEIIILSTRGSVENARLIELGTVHLAFVQSDVAYCFAKGEKLFRFPSDDLNGIAALYTEAVHIVARRELGVSKVAELQGRVVAVGPQKSGTEYNAATILAMSGLAYERIEERYLTSDEAAEEILAGRLDAAFITAGVPSPTVSRLGESVKLIAVPPNNQRRLLDAYPCFVSTSIPAGTYPGQGAEVAAVGVRALLVARSDLDDDLVRRITSALFDEAGAFKGKHAAVAGASLADAMRGMCLPLHPGAEELYVERRLITRTARHYVVLGLVLAVLLLAGAILFRLRKALLRTLRRSFYLRTGGVLILLIVSGTLGTYYFEREVNENFGDIFESFWSGMVYVLSGFEDRAPVTTGGRFTSILIFLANVGILGSVAGGFAVGLAKWGEPKMPRNVERHVVICNWNSKGDEIVKQLHAAQAAPDTEIVIITERDVGEKELRKHKEYERAFFVRSDPVLHDVLRSSRVHLARSVIILADEDSPDPDAKSTLITLAVSRLWNEHQEELQKKGKKKEEGEGKREEKEEGKKDERPHIVAEAVNHRKIRHLKDAGADEVICASDFGLGVLAQCAIHKRLSDVYQDLLKYSDDTCEIYVVDDPEVTKDFKDKSFEEAATMITAGRDAGNPAILIGLRRNDQIILNPRGPDREPEKAKQFIKFKEGDSLIVVAYNKPDLRNLKKR